MKRRKSEAGTDSEWGWFTLPNHVKLREGADWRGLPVVVQTPSGRRIVRVPKARRNWAVAVEPSYETWVERVFGFRRQLGAATPDIADDARTALRELQLRAQDGDGAALWEVAALVCKTADWLEVVMKDSPQSLAPLARRLSRWPLNRSKHPGNTCSDSWLEKIELGAGVGIVHDRSSKWKTDSAAQIAIRLYEHVNRIRDENPILEFADGEEQRLQDWLPVLSPDSAIKWWALAWDVLTKTYPKPETIEEFDALVPRLTRGGAENSRRRYPSKLRQRIHDIIRERFLAFSGFTAWKRKAGDVETPKISRPHHNRARAKAANSKPETLKGASKHQL